MKRISILTLVVVMVLGMSMTVFAGNHSKLESVPDKSGYTDWLVFDLDNQDTVIAEYYLGPVSYHWDGSGYLVRSFKRGYKGWTSTDGGKTWAPYSSHSQDGSGSTGIRGGGKTIYLSSRDVPDKSGKGFFFKVPVPPLQRAVGQMETKTVLKQLLILAPSVIGLVVSVIGLRKAWAFLVSQLSKA